MAVDYAAMVLDLRVVEEELAAILALARLLARVVPEGLIDESK